MGNKRILAVDDDKAVLRNFKQILELEGYIVDTAETGRDAIDRSNSKSYNLALIDIRLPDMDGTELLTSMREREPRTVKIIVTGYPSLENAIQAVNRGADGYVVKPIVNMDAFLSTIREHLKKQEESERYTEEKVAEYIESRAREHEAEEAML